MPNLSALRPTYWAGIEFLSFPKAFIFFGRWAPPVPYWTVLFSSKAVTGFLKEIPVACILELRSVFLLIIFYDFSLMPSWKSFQNLSFSASYILCLIGLSFAYLCWLAIKSWSPYVTNLFFFKFDWRVVDLSSYWMIGLLFLGLDAHLPLLFWAMATCPERVGEWLAYAYELEFSIAMSLC